MKTIIYSAVAFIALMCNLQHTVFAAGLDPTLLGTQADTVPPTHTADIPKTNNDASEEANAHAADANAYVPDVAEHHEEEANAHAADANAHIPDVTEHHEEEANADDQYGDEHVPSLREHQEGDADHSNADPDANTHVPDATEHHEETANAHAADANAYVPDGEANAHAADANAHVSDGDTSARNDAAIPRSDNVHTEGHDGQTDSDNGPSDNNYLKTAEDLKHEAHMKEMASKIAAEPVPPNSKAAAEAIASSPPSQEKIDPLTFEANAAAAIPDTDNVHVGGGDHGLATQDDNYLKTPEQLKQEADRLEESARKIAAAEPIPPNSKAAAEAIASSPQGEEVDPKQFEANAAAAIPKSDNAHEGGEDLGSDDHPGPMKLAHAEILKKEAEEQAKLDEESARAIAAEVVPPNSKAAAEAISIKFEEPELEEEEPSSQGYPVINTNKTIVDYLIDGDDSSVGVSLRYSMITGADKYQVCANCVIKEGVRVNTEGNVKEFDKDISPFFCQVVPPCVSVFEVNVGDHSFSMRAHVPEKGWTNWSPSLAFKIEPKEGVLTHVPHREL